MIAGHDFQDVPGGRRCVGYSCTKGTTCGAAWADVRSCSEADIDGPLGIAHSGRLSVGEYAEIVKARDLEIEAVWAAVTDAASSGSR